MSTESAMDAARRREQQSLLALRQREWIVLGFFLLLALAAALNIKRVEVKGISMEPAYFDGETLVVWKTVPRGALKPGDVIVFKSSDGDELIKRIVYVANPYAPIQFPPVGFPDRITTPGGAYIRSDAPPSITFQGYFNAVNSGKIEPPSRDRTIYVMGDNILHSNDSRDFGPIDPKQILGKAM